MTIINSDISPLKKCTGATWDGEQELRPHPNTINGDDDAESGYFERLGAKTETALEKFFTAWGTTCAKHPWIVLLCGMSLPAPIPKLI